MCLKYRQAIEDSLSLSSISRYTPQALGYAIPVDDVVDIIEGLMNRTIREEKAPEEEQGFLGITVQAVTSDVASAYDMPKGVYITSVTEGSGAERAGLLTGFRPAYYVVDTL